MTPWRLLLLFAIALLSLWAALTSKTALDSAPWWIFCAASLAMIIVSLLLRFQSARRQAIFQLVGGAAFFLVGLLSVGKALAVGEPAALVVAGIVGGALGVAFGAGVAFGGLVLLRGPRLER